MNAGHVCEMAVKIEANPDMSSDKLNQEPDDVLDAILAALWPNAELGWNAWSQYAATGEWN